jgi:hypothetical protein
MALMNFLGKYGVQTGLGAMAGYEHAGGSDASFIDKAIGTVGGAALGAGMGVGLNKLNHARLNYKASKPGAPQQLQGTGKFIPKMNYTQKGPNFVQTSKPVGHLPASHPIAQQRVANNTLVKRRGITTPPSNAELLKVVKPQELKTMTNMPYNKTWANTGGIAAGIGATGYIANNQSQKNRERIQQKYSDPYQTKHASYNHVSEALYLLNRKEKGMKNVYTQIGLEKVAGFGAPMLGGIGGAAAGYYASSHDPESTGLHRFGGTVLGGVGGSTLGNIVGARRFRKGMGDNFQGVKNLVTDFKKDIGAPLIRDTNLKAKEIKRVGDKVYVGSDVNDLDLMLDVVKKSGVNPKAFKSTMGDYALTGAAPGAMVAYGAKKRYDRNNK